MSTVRGVGGALSDVNGPRDLRVCVLVEEAKIHDTAVSCSSDLTAPTAMSNLKRFRLIRYRF